MRVSARKVTEFSGKVLVTGNVVEKCVRHSFGVLGYLTDCLLGLSTWLRPNALLLRGLWTSLRGKISTGSYALW